MDIADTLVRSHTHTRTHTHSLSLSLSLSLSSSLALSGSPSHTLPYVLSVFLFLSLVQQFVKAIDQKKTCFVFVVFSFKTVSKKISISFVRVSSKWLSWLTQALLTCTTGMRTACLRRTAVILIMLLFQVIGIVSRHNLVIKSDFIVLIWSVHQQVFFSGKFFLRLNFNFCDDFVVRQKKFEAVPKFFRKI